MIASPSPFPAHVPAAAAASSAPWWGVPVVAGGFLIIGAILGFYFNRLQDKHRADREKLQRWDQNVLDHTSRVVLLTERFITETHEHETAVQVMALAGVAQMQAGQDIDSPFPHVPTLEQLMDTYETLTSELTSLRLIATSSIRDVAQTVKDEVWQLLMMTDRADIRAQEPKLRESVSSLETAVRKHFDLR